MKIIINSSHQRFGGAIQVALSFINECKAYSEHEFHVFLGQGLRKEIERESFPANFHFYDFDFGAITVWKTFVINNTLKKLEKRIKPDCIIATSGPTYFHSRTPQIIGYNLPLYIYPESPFLQTISLYRKIRFRIKMLFHFHYFSRDATAFVTQTDDVNVRVRKALGTQEVYTVTNTYSAFYLNWKRFEPKLPAKKDNHYRLLTISAFYGHKNLDIIPQVVAELDRRGITNFEFVLTLKQEAFHTHFGRDLRRKISNVGPVRPDECPSLYDECDIMFLPTLAECFSASYPEAMIMEKPIITTDLGFARSICSKSALFYKPMDSVAAADAIEKLISDRDLWQKLVGEGKLQLTHFDTAEERARKYIELCSKFANGFKN